MQKIITEALKLAGFKNSEELARVVNATPNPIAATEMLLGVFEEILPETFGEIWKSKYLASESLLIVNRIDSLNNVVYYTRYEHNTKTVYYLTKEDYANKVYVEERPNDWYTSGTIRVNGYHTIETSLALETFVDTNTNCKDINTILEWHEWTKEARSYGIEPENANLESA